MITPLQYDKQKIFLRDALLLRYIVLADKSLARLEEGFRWNIPS